MICRRSANREADEAEDDAAREYIEGVDPNTLVPVYSKISGLPLLCPCSLPVTKTGGAHGLVAGFSFWSNTQPLVVAKFLRGGKTFFNEAMNLLHIFSHPCANAVSPHVSLPLCFDEKARIISFSYAGASLPVCDFYFIFLSFSFLGGGSVYVKSL